ncbi:MAG: BMP family protein [Solobacterium sp.]|jgi:basic membrane protein A|nr:BMP family protein [Solobacterium sp.]
MKKFVKALLVATVAASMIGCSSGGQNSSVSTASSSAGTKKIALVTNKVGTNAFLTQMIEGLKDSAESHGFEASNVECSDTAEFSENIRAYAEEGYDLIIGGGWESSDPMQEICGEFPDTDFALIDTEVDNDRIKCISYNEQEGAYVIGALAALTVDGDSHVYGGVHVNEGPGSWKYRYGFMEGVLSQDPSATFIFNYVGTYNDPAKAKTLAEQEYSQGAKFINAAAAGGDAGIFEAAKSKNFYTSGQDTDETDAANPWIVSSQIKDTYNTIVKIIDSFYDGWNTDNEVWGIKESAIGAVNVNYDSKNPRSDRLSDDDITKLKGIVENIRSGKLDLTNIPDEDTYKAQH